ncbi:MAG: UDP-N-acetylmuramoyl-L-alanine--D-glutamate ligase [Butyricicoccus sp.]|nr:UDP-N-acetylmuramoyl-L-alanine--D-glutamate ligase [Butyricicoccus sp.]
MEGEEALTFDEYFNSLRGRRIAVVGTGVSNMPLIELLVRYGCDVTACDMRTRDALGDTARELEGMGAVLRLGPDYLEDMRFDVVFRTPGLHPNALAGARENGAVLTSEMEAFFALCPCRIIAVTGSDGKTTTTMLISELLKKQGFTVHLGGNIGKPLLAEVPEMKPGDIAVLELSSFQLHGMDCRPDVAVVTNVFPNHLDVHPSYEDYIWAKKSIFSRQGAGCRLVLNLDNEITRSFAGEARSDILWFSRREDVQRGCSCTDGVIRRCGGKLMDASEIRLPGVHNIENMMAAFAAVDGLVDAENCREVARTFAGVAHRLELIRTLRGVRYYNDSIASSPTRTTAGLRSFEEKTILIAGGHDKHIPFDGLAREIVERVKALFLTGETAQKIYDAVMEAEKEAGGGPPVYVADGFAETVRAAADYAKEGDVVLLSPACSSFDRFKNFAERGNTFRKIVEGLE